MKKSILLAASALTLAWAGAASAQHNDHVCLDETCDMVSLFGLEAAAQGPSVGRIDNVHGDRNLVCTCDSVEAYAAAAED